MNTRKVRICLASAAERSAIERGLQQGTRLGEAEVLRCLLRRKFGILPEWVEAKLQQAEQTELQAWAERILDAQSVEQVFGSGLKEAVCS